VGGDSCTFILKSDKGSTYLAWHHSAVLPVLLIQIILILAIVLSFVVG
jgi:hypothetical protein